MKAVRFGISSRDSETRKRVLSASIGAVRWLARVVRVLVVVLNGQTSPTLPSTPAIFMNHNHTVGLIASSYGQLGSICTNTRCAFISFTDSQERVPGLRGLLDSSAFFD
jgi:hypothetical protein